MSTSMQSSENQRLRVLFLCTELCGLGHSTMRQTACVNCCFISRRGNALTMASIVQPSGARSKASTRACLESARAPDSFAGKADESAVGKTYETASQYLFVLTYLALTGSVAADFAGLVAGGRFAFALVIRISVVAGHPSRPASP
mgnify:CR=1 FL=1